MEWAVPKDSFIPAPSGPLTKPYRSPGLDYICIFFLQGLRHALLHGWQRVYWEGSALALFFPNSRTTHSLYC